MILLVLQLLFVLLLLIGSAIYRVDEVYPDPDLMPLFYELYLKMENIFLTLALT